MAHIPSIERERVQNINYVMDDLHTSVNDIYEDMIDEEYIMLRTNVLGLIKKLKIILDSIEDDI